MNYTRNLCSALVLTASMLGLGAAPALAARGAVKVECQGNCANVTLGGVCDSYSSGSTPIQVSCDDTSAWGSHFVCNNQVQTCIRILYDRKQTLDQWCVDGSGADVLVTCEH